jgi:hypothetical protein
MSHKRPDLDPRGSPVQPHSRVELQNTERGREYTEIHTCIRVNRELAKVFKQKCVAHDIDKHSLMRQLFFSTCKELDIDVDTYEAPKRSIKGAMVILAFNEVALDECDMPGVAAPQELGDFDPYFHTYFGEVPNVGYEEGQRRSTQMTKLRNAKRKAVNSIARLSALKTYTDVFHNGCISKEEACRELEAILLMMPGDIKDALWGWCSVNDAINICHKWEAQLKKEMREQLELERVGRIRNRRLSLQLEFQRQTKEQRDKLVALYEEQKAKRPPGEEWPRFTVSPESYLDHAADPARQGDSPIAWWEKMKAFSDGRALTAQDYYIRESDGNIIVEKVHSECTINLYEGLDNETK